MKNKESGDKLLHINKPIIVEGKYDRQKLESIIRGVIITTNGFSIFTKNEKLALIRRLASERGIILLTDSDGAGGVIRSYITSAVPAGSVVQIYIPKIRGKEKRKPSPSKEGILGVEGIDTEELYRLLLPFSDEGGAHCDINPAPPVTKADFYADGMSGCPDAARRRDMLAEYLRLPDKMTPNALLAAVNVLITKDEYRTIMAKLTENTEQNKRN